VTLAAPAASGGIPAPAPPRANAVAPSAEPAGAVAAVAAAAGSAATGPARGAPTGTHDDGVAAARGESIAAAPERAQLALLGNGTQVMVDGVAKGSCPVRVAVEPGSHTVVFSFPATGEAKAEHLTVAPAERVTVRADFTTATPSVRVTR
jgi:hypothetical protein